MSDEEAVKGYWQHRLAALLHIGLEPDQDGPSSPDERKELLLRAALAETLPPAREVTEDALPVIVGQLPLLGRSSVGGSLLDPDTPLEVLQKIKDHGKQLARAKGSEAEHTAASTIYYAAVASAILFHDRRITSNSYAALVHDFDALRDKRWMDPKLASHFAKAGKKCRKKAE